MENLSIKDLASKLRREQARAKDLEKEIKGLSDENANLKQDKAELIRKNHSLSEDANKVTLLNDRNHRLQREIQARDAVIATERSAAEQARAETEEVRSNANASIAQWIAAEKQWTADQQALSEAATQLQARVQHLEKELLSQKSACAEAAASVQLERDRYSKMSNLFEKAETEANNMLAEKDRLQNKIRDLELKVHKLDLAGEKQKETIALKDTDIQTLEAKLADSSKTIEDLEQANNSLRDHVNAAKALKMEGESKNEELKCALNAAEKEIELLKRTVQGAKHDLSSSAQDHDTLQRTMSELKERCSQQQSELMRQTVAIRQHELECNQWDLERTKMQNECGELSFKCSSLEAELNQLKTALASAAAATESLEAEKAALLAEKQKLLGEVDVKNEEMVLFHCQLDDCNEAHANTVFQLENDIAAQRGLINELKAQLNSTSANNAVYQSKILEESESAVKVRQELKHLLQQIHAKERELCLSSCAAEKAEVFAASLTEWYNAPQALVFQWRAAWQQSQSEATAFRRQMETLRLDVEAKEEALAGLQQDVLEKANRVSSLASEKTAAESNRASLESQLQIVSQRAEALSSEVKELEATLLATEGSLAEKHAACVAASSRNEELLYAALDFHKAALSQCEAQGDQVQELWNSRADCLIGFFKDAFAKADTEITQLREKKEQAEAACRELVQFAEDAKVSLSKQDCAVMEARDALRSRIALLEGQVALARKEKEQAATRLSTLLSRFEEEQKGFDAFRKESELRLEAERRTAQVAVEAAAKLRSGIEYEVKRKREYKDALEKAKRMLAESEHARRTDSAHALEAIRKANKESHYWVSCFDQLKGMLEKSRQNGGRLPSIDADTIHRLEEAKAKISPIQKREVNLVPSSGPAAKRARGETNGVAE